MQFIRMVAALEFHSAGLGVCFAVGHPFCHTIPFVQLVQQHKSPFFLLNSIVDPDLSLRNEFINMVMTTSCEVNIERASHQSAIHNPYAYAIFQLLP
jgi:hypothetical protein